MRNVLAALERLGVGMLITIGGDDTAFTAHKLAQAAGGWLRVVHVPKTIDNDLDLPHDVWTFGYQTARAHRRRDRPQPDGRREDDRPLVLRRRDGPQGRPPRARHRQGRGRDADAHPRRVRGARSVRLSTIVDTLVGAIVKRLASGRTDGVAVLAEGLAEIVPPGGHRGARDGRARRARAHPHRRDQLRRHQQGRACTSGSPSSGSRRRSSSKNIGYEVRCADPIPFDMEYTRDLGYCAAQVRHRGRHQRARLDPAGALQARPLRRASWTRRRAGCACAWSTSTATGTASPTRTCCASSEATSTIRASSPSSPPPPTPRPRASARLFGHLVERGRPVDRARGVVYFLKNRPRRPDFSSVFEGFAGTGLERVTEGGLLERLRGPPRMLWSRTSRAASMLC